MPEELPIQLNETVLREGSTMDLAQSAAWTAAYMLNRLGPERAGALLTWAKDFAQSIDSRLRQRAAELARVEHQTKIQRWEQEALERSLRSGVAAAAVPSRPTVTVLSMEDML